MKNITKALLAAMALPLLAPTTFGTALAHSADTCPQIAKYSTTPVKHILTMPDGEELFLNSNGIRVAPCEKDGATRFYLLSGYKDGDILYMNSMSDALMPNSKDKFLLNRPDGTSYGDGYFRITDTHDFRQDFITKNVTDGVMPAAVSEMVSIKANPEWLDVLPRKYASQPADKKEALIKVHYQKIADRYKDISSNTDSFVQMAVRDIDAIHPSDYVINQYTLDENFSEKKPGFVPVYGDIDGKLFLMYEDAVLEDAFLRSVPAFVLSVISDDSYTVNQRLALAHRFDTDQKFVAQLAKDYREMTMAGYGLGIESDEDMNASGLAAYKSLSDAEKAKYNQLLVQINDRVFDKDWSSLKDSLSPSEYKKLPGKDKLKYAKEHNEKGKAVYNKVKPSHTVVDKAGNTKEVPDIYNVQK